MLENKRDLPAFEVLPAIDVRGGRVVRLVQGDFARETVYGPDPAEVAARFIEAGAHWLHLVDLDGARDPAARQLVTLERVAARVGDRAHLEVAGGLRDDRAVAGVLDAGAARVVVGTAALDDPAFAARLVEAHGPWRVAAALDVRDGFAVGHGWRIGARGIPVEAALDALADTGVATFEVTAIDRDGTLEGPDLELLGRLVARGRGAVIASAGIASLEQLRAVRDLGCAGAIVGRALYDGHLDLAAALRI